MKRAIGKIVKILVILAVIGGIGYGGYYLYEKYYGADTAETSATAYTPVAVTTGNLAKEVISTGSLSIADTEAVTAPFSVTIENMLVQAGQTIAEGDQLAKVDVSTLDAAVGSLNTQLESVDNTLASLAGSYSDTKTVTNTAAGRVKAIYGQVGDNVQDVIAEHGCLYVLSLDGKMKVDVDVPSPLAVNTALSVSDGTKTWAGTVIKCANGMATVTFSDASVAPGSTVSVLSNSVLLGSGQCAVNMPLEVSALVDGYISAANLKLNTYYEKRAGMYSVTNVAVSEAFLDAQDQRAELNEELAAVRALKESPYICASFSGIVSQVNAARNTAVNKGDTLLTMYVGDPTQMIVSVDELDIINLSVGQSATVAMDAITDKTYNATVEYISQIGTASSGITSYSVTVKVEGDEQLKLGMNGTVTIGVGEQQNALLVPLTALQSDAKGTYVWLYSDSYQATEEAPGIKTYVTTGLSNENYAAVTGGLNAGDQVLVVRTAASAVSATSTDFGGFSGMPDMGSGTMPDFSGGNAPSMPTGGNGGTGTGGSGTRQNNNAGGGSAPASGGNPGGN